jgi:hypothetical protein
MVGLPSNAVLQPEHSAKVLRKIKKGIANREQMIRICEQNMYVSKWMRPWNVVPKLRNFRPAEGDYGVGVEVELGFETLEASRTVAKHVRRWQYITLDYEGGANPIELTFPPIPYSKLGKNSQVMRYLSYLSANRQLVRPHPVDGGHVGTHVNVSCGHMPLIDYGRLESVNGWLRHITGFMMNGFTAEQRAASIKYFGRKPYGLGNMLETGRKWIEWKLFNSTIDPARFRQYADIAVSLTRLVCSNEAISREAVVQALEDGHSGRIRKLVKEDALRRAAAHAVPAPPVPLAA